MQKHRLSILVVLLGALCVLPAFHDAAAAEITEAADADRKIASLDIIVVDVVGEKDLTNKEFRVSSGGTISYPYLGSLEVKGKTPAEVEAVIRDQLGKDYIIDPQVIVTVKEYRVRTVSVIGQVNKPGVIALPAEQKMDIVEAIAQAGDLTKVANKNRIEVSRKGKTHRYTLDELKKQTDPDKKFFLEPGDVIFVHESFF